MKGKGLNIQLSDEEDEFKKFMPPSRVQFEQQYGDTIVADYESDSGDLSASRGRDKTKGKNDEEAPKATADVMMSRNLKGGAGKNFNFAFSSDGDDDSQHSTQQPNLKAEAFVSDSGKS